MPRCEHLNNAMHIENAPTNSEVPRTMTIGSNSVRSLAMLKLGLETVRPGGILFSIKAPTMAIAAEYMCRQNLSMVLGVAFHWCMIFTTI
mmetsp:Transcript_117239/g.203643  ORF Transcript_117239/g.203643 Transcript_117239/m.203643 type:complete len:90 (-) Transcript_117239:852-1121(-)